jgi:hypothetical protein
VFRTLSNNIFSTVAARKRSDRWLMNEELREKRTSEDTVPS